jgi:uncharacterized repeat protein (TIGR03803 family)
MFPSKTSRGFLSSSLLAAILAAVVLATMFSANYVSASTEKVLHSFEPYLNGQNPNTMVADAAGNLYVVTNAGGRYNSGLVMRVTPNSQGGATQTVLYTFKGGTDGIRPIGLFLDAAGNLYGITAGGGTLKYGTVFALTPTAHGEWNETILYSFDSSNGYLSYGLAEDSSGNLYGTTYNYGPTYGSVFELTPASGTWTLTTLHVFSGGSDGGFPYGELTLDQAGNIYGTAQEGGIGNNGLVFEFSPSAGGTSTEKVLYDFLAGNDGATPASKVTFDTAGNLYGTTGRGGGSRCNATGGCGTVFELSPTGGQWTETILYSFPSKGGNGWGPQDLYFDNSGNIFGAAYYGPNEICCGAVFELSFSSGHWSETNVFLFSSSDGAYEANNGLAFGPAGQIYGTTTLGGTDNDLNGAVYELTPVGSHWKLTTLYGFPTTDGAYPYSGLAMDAAGNLYGTASQNGLNNFGMAYKLSPDANGSWAETDIYNFTTGLAVGITAESNPSGLTLDSSGNLYGTAEETGSKNYGSVFKLTPGAKGGYTEKDIFDMTGTTVHPVAGLISDHSGNLYGTTLQGGTHGFGAVYQLTPQANGSYKQTVLYSFGGYPIDGSNPTAALLLDSAGNLYGTTGQGGDSANCKGIQRNPVGCGTVFELQPIAGGGWTELMLHSFTGATTDGATPAGSLIFDSNGNLFGTTAIGGKKNCASGGADSGCGTVFELSPGNGNWTENILYEFTNNGDGALPHAGLVFDAFGNLYGTTLGIANTSYGTVFKLTPATGGGWSETTVYAFDITHGEYPYSNLILDAAGNLYGTTARGGDSAAYGTVFEITP